jgi:hypothetical protein
MAPHEMKMCMMLHGSIQHFSIRAAPSAIAPYLSRLSDIHDPTAHALFDRIFFGFSLSRQSESSLKRDATCC